jgi:hypothetical protein
MGTKRFNKRAITKAVKWRKAWRDHKPAMAANLAHIHSMQRAAKAARIERIKAILVNLPEGFTSSQSKELFASALTLAGHEPTPARLKRLRTYAVRYGLLRYEARLNLWINLV